MGGGGEDRSYELELRGARGDVGRLERPAARRREVSEVSEVSEVRVEVAG